MSEAVTSSDFVAYNFMAIRTAVVRKLGPAKAIIASHLHWRTSVNSSGVHVEEGKPWLRITMEELGDEIGLSHRQVRRATDDLITRGLIEAKQFRLVSPYDRTFSYRIALDGLEPAGEIIPIKKEDPQNVEVTERSNASGQNVQMEVTERSNVQVTKRSNAPSIKTYKTKDGEKTQAEVDGAFEKFYDAYPRKVAPRVAQKAFISALQRAHLADIARGVAAYRKSVAGQEEKFIAHPASWLNADRWLDKVSATGVAVVEEAPKMRRLDELVVNYDEPPRSLPPLRPRA